MGWQDNGYATTTMNRRRNFVERQTVVPSISSTCRVGTIEKKNERNSDVDNVYVKSK